MHLNTRKKPPKRATIWQAVGLASGRWLVYYQLPKQDVEGSNPVARSHSYKKNDSCHVEQKNYMSLSRLTASESHGRWDGNSSAVN